MSFADLKRGSKSNFEKLAQEMSKAGTTAGGSKDDEKFWKPTLDKAGNAFAVIRFLPAPEGEDLPFVKVWSHGFQGPGGWYIENSLTTLGEEDPVGKYNSQLWNSTTDDQSPAREQARKQKRKTSYYSNIYVVKDSANPENEGKVFLFRYGKQIYDLLNAAMHPKFEDEQAINPFDMWTGANFKVKVRTGQYGPNYEKSEFDSASVLGEDDELEKIYGQLHSLQAFLDRKNFKSYSDLEAKMLKVLGMNESAKPAQNERAAKPEKEIAAPAAKEEDKPPFVMEDDDDLDDYFKSIQDED